MTSPSDSIFCLMRIAHARFLSDTIHCPIETSKFVCLSVCLSACLPACLPACLSVLLAVCLPACLFVYLAGWLAGRLSDWLSACLPACLSVWLAVWLSGCLSVLRRCLVVDRDSSLTAVAVCRLGHVQTLRRCSLLHARVCGEPSFHCNYRATHTDKSSEKTGG